MTIGYFRTLGINIWLKLAVLKKYFYLQAYLVKLHRLFIMLFALIA